MKNKKLIIPFIILLTVVWLGLMESDPNIPSRPTDVKIGNLQTTILAGGCFWCVESDFMKLDGVVDAVSGYSGGERPNPSYEDYDKTSVEFSTPHVEVVKVSYDSSRVSYRELLEFFFRHIDPTDGAGQFCDRGQAYRPAVFVDSEQQRAVAEDVKKNVADTLGEVIPTKIEEQAKFWPAEEYHQDYAVKNPKRYKYYRWSCGRDQRIEELWGTK